MNSNRKLVPEAKEALDKYKMEAANDEEVTGTYLRFLLFADPKKHCTGPKHGLVQ